MTIRELFVPLLFCAIPGCREMHEAEVLLVVRKRQCLLLVL